MIWKAESVAVLTKTKKSHQFFKGKNRVTPSVTAPGDTNFSDATEWQGLRVHAMGYGSRNCQMTARLHGKLDVETSSLLASILECA